MEEYLALETPRIHHLEEFVRLEGRYIPPDIALFDREEIYEQYCPLCGREHDEFNAKTWFEPNPSELTTKPAEYNTFLCYQCDYEVDLVDTYDEEKINIVTWSRIQTLITQKEFPFDVLTYCNLPNECVWCGESVAVDERESSPIPVGMGDKNFQEFSSCKKCFKYISPYYPWNYAFQDQCYHCKTTYPVTKDELEARGKNNTLCKHLCGTCGLNFGLDSYTDRFDWVECNNCLTSLSIDKSLVVNLNHNLFGTKVLCDLCIQGSRHPSLIEDNEAHIIIVKETLKAKYGARYVFHIKGPYYAVVHEKSEKEFYFSILETVGDKIKRLYKSTLLRENPEDIITVAVEAAYKLIKNKTRKTLFDGD